MYNYLPSVSLESRPSLNSLIGKFLAQSRLGGKIQNGVLSFCPRDAEIRLVPPYTLGRQLALFVPQRAVCFTEPNSKNVYDRLGFNHGFSFRTNLI